jgi:hypothetical protein
MIRRLLAPLLVGLLCLLHGPVGLAQSSDGASANALQVLEQFSQKPAAAIESASTVQNHERQVIMFAIGAVLLSLLLATAGLGVTIAITGRPLFLPHMILAGLTVTMAIVHVIVGMVWFYPF